MRFKLKSLLIAVSIAAMIAALVAFLFGPLPPVTLAMLPYAWPSTELRTLTPTYQATEWLYETDSLFDRHVTPEKFYGQEFSKINIWKSVDGEIYRELVVDIGENGEQDVRIRARLADSIPDFEQLKHFKTLAEFDAVFECSERGSMSDSRNNSCIQYWGGFVIEGQELRVVLVSANVFKGDEDEQWELLDRTIRESKFAPK